MRILAIETSCDDTGIAILKIPTPKGYSNTQSPSFEVFSNIVSSQIKIHKKYGGVYPALAKREHQKNLVCTLKLALEKAEMLRNSKSRITNYKQILNSKYKILNTILEREPELVKKLIPFLKKHEKPDVDLIAVTNGPGLEPCLWVGVNFAKALSYFWNIPVVPINHVESHILVNLIDLNAKCQIFPAVALVVSGGHTQLILMKGFGKYKILGQTRDDAAGECFDKCARILGLGYPGGPAIAAEATKFRVSSFKFQVELPRPMINSKDYDFSFSGLKTAVLYLNQKSKSSTDPHSKNQKYKAAMAKEIQQAIIDVLLKKTLGAAKDYKAKSIIVGGGVAANNELREQFKEKIAEELPNTQYLTPNTQLCTDNALMTAITAYFHKNQIKNWQNIKAEANLRISN